MSYEATMTHISACVRAIDSIGGDPATVAELVHVLRWIGGDINVNFSSVAQQDALLRVLAKLPEAK